MTESLRHKGARGGGITLLAQGGRMLVQLVGVVVLSRLLSPGDFGLLAMVMAFMTLAELVRDFGLSSSALQAKELSQQQASNLFWLSWALGSATGLLLVASTPLIVRLYSEPRLEYIVPAMAVTLFLGGAQAQIQVQLARQLKFSALALSNFLAPTVGLALAVVAALLGWGYWALVLQAVGGALVLLLVQIGAARWVPWRPRRGQGTGDLVRSGAHLGAAHMLTWAASNVDSLVAGVRFGSVRLGHYNRGFQLTVTMIGGFLAPLTQVAIPMLNEARKSGKRPADLLVKMQALVAIPVCMAMVLLALTAPSLVPLLLGDQWGPAVPIIQILAAAECLHSLSFISYWGFLTEGLSRQLLNYNLLTKPITVLAVLIGSNWGIEGLARGYLVGLAFAWPTNVIWLARTAGYEWPKFLGNGARILATAAISYAAAALVLGERLQTPSWSAVALAGVSVVAIFVVLVGALPAGRRDLARMFAVTRDFVK